MKINEHIQPKYEKQVAKCSITCPSHIGGWMHVQRRCEIDNHAIDDNNFGDCIPDKEGKLK